MRRMYVYRVYLEDKNYVYSYAIPAFDEAGATWHITDHFSEDNGFGYHFSHISTPSKLGTVKSYPAPASLYMLIPIMDKETADV